MLNNAVYTMEEIERLKNLQDENDKALLAEILKEAEEALTKEDRQNLGFAYLITGDKRYFEKTKEGMLELCKEECWTPGGLHGGSFTGRCELTSAAKSMYMASAYSVLGDLLTEEERALVVKNTYEKGIKLIYEDWVKPETRIHALDTMGHNWWMVMVSSGAYSAVCMMDAIPECKEIAEVSAKCCEAWFKYKGNYVNAKPVNSDKGAFWEGYSYLDYSLNEYLSFATAYKKLLGKRPFDDEEILKEYANYYMNFFYPGSDKCYFVNTGDSGLGEGACDSQFKALIYGVDLPEIRWYINNHNPQMAKLTKLQLMDELKKEAKMPDRLCFCHDKVGFAVMRDSYEKDATALMIKCGDTWNHAHADAGHFSLYKNGVQEVYEAGGPENYGKQSYQSYYVQSQAHNTVLFNGKGQDYRDNYKDHAKIPGSLHNFVDEENFRYVLADCTGPMGRYFRKHHRHFLWVGNTILVYDDIECYEKGEVNFLMHCEDENCFKMLTPCEYTIHDGYRKKSDVFNCKYRSYNLPTAEEDHAKFVSVMALDGSEATYEETDKYIKVVCGEAKFYINKLSDGRIMHNNCIINAEDYTTDAVILSEFNGEIGVVNGSIVKKSGEVLFSEWARINGHIN